MEVGPNDAPVEWKTLFREKELWLIVLAGILCFYQPLFTHQTFFFRDLFVHFLPQKRLLAQILKEGELPLWDPFLHGGQPLLGDVQNLVLYPTNLLYLILPPLIAFNVDIVFHVILSAVGAYLLARTLKLSPLSAFVVAIVYGYCGYTLSLTNLMNRLLAMPYLPLILLFWRQFLNVKRSRWFILAVFSGVFQIFAGAPEMTAITFGFLFLWCMVPHQGITLLRRFCLSLLLMLFVVGVAAVQILPLLEMTQQSSRSDPGIYKIFAGWSMNPKRLPELFVSNFFGYGYGLIQTDYWGSSMEDRHFPYILSIYFGAPTLLLAVAAPFLKGSSPLSFRLRLLLLLALIASILFSCGRYVPFFDSFFKVAILINRFRYPIKFLAAAILPAALLAGATVEIVFPAGWKSRNFLIVGWTFSGGLLLSFCLLRFSPSVYLEFLNYYFGSSAPEIQAGFRFVLLYASAILLAATLLLQLRFLQPKAWHGSVFVGLLAVDLLYAGFFINSYAPSDFFTARPLLANMVLNNIHAGRFFRDQDPKNIVLEMPANDIIYAYRWEQETLYNYVGASYSIPVTYHQDYDGLGKKEIQRLTRFLYTSPWDRRGPILTASGISVIFAPLELNLPGIVTVAKIHTSSNTAFYLLRNLNSAPARFVSTIKQASSSEDAYRMLIDPGFDPTAEVILEDEAEIEPSCGAVAVERTNSRNNSSSYKAASLPCDGVVVFPEPYYPGWEVTVDGSPERLLRANFAFSAVRVTAGAHSIERIYRPASVRYGLLFSGLSTTILVVLAILSRLDRRKMQPQ